MTFHAYMLRYSDGSYYLGHRDNFDNCIAPRKSFDMGFDKLSPYSGRTEA